RTQSEEFIMQDSEIARDVLDELLDDARVDAGKIDVNVDSGNVTLTGAVLTFHEKWDAGEDAWRIYGVRSVENDILVDLTGERQLDTDLVAAAEKGLATNSLVPPGSVKVTAEDGWITMRGNVHHHYERQAAEFEVRFLAGLRGYTNLVTISSS